MKPIFFKEAIYQTEIIKWWKEKNSVFKSNRRPTQVTGYFER